MVKSVIKPWVWIFLMTLCLCCGYVSAADVNREASKKTGDKSIHSEWGGHVRGGGSLSWHQNGSCCLITGDNPFRDGFVEARIKNRTTWSDLLYTDVHYELVFSGFDTRDSKQKLQRRFGNIATAIGGAGIANDTRRLFDFSDEISEDDQYILYHRLDRASLSMSPSWGLIRLGRQALTWGNGFLFNPMDLFNPFAPSDIIRDYKRGDDMALLTARIQRAGEVQFLVVPRRNPSNDSVEWDSSSLAGKLHFAHSSVEFDVMVSRHYDDYVIGAGSKGYLGNAACRMDATYTFLNGPAADQDNFFSLVANTDYYWVWGGKNFYGLLEIYYNGLGGDDYGSALFNPKLADRVTRGELFALGRIYLAGRIDMEVHPLFKVYLTAINNLQDPSGLVQPHAVVGLTQNTELTVGADISWGDTGTEYGGFYISGTDCLIAGSESVYFWLTYYF